MSAQLCTHSQSQLQVSGLQWSLVDSMSDVMVLNFKSQMPCGRSQKPEASISVACSRPLHAMVSDPLQPLKAELT